MRIDYFLLPAFAALVFACGANQMTEAQPAEASLVSSPTADTAWVSLFDGTSLAAWHTYGKAEAGAAWKVAEDGGSFYLDTSDKGDWQTNNGGDLVSNAAYENYELVLEWKIGACGNSGIIYNVIESEAYDYVWQTGPEMQILDNSCHPDAKIYTHRAGDLYDLIAGDSTVVRPAGTWNKVRLVVTDGEVQHWLNGTQVVTYVNSGETWQARIAQSKFTNMKGFGQATGGHIALQDHGDPVWFRNVKIREL